MDIVYEFSFGPEITQENQNRLALSAFIGAQADRSVTCFSANTTADCFPMLAATYGQHSSRYPFFWWLRGMIKLENDKQAAPAISQLVASVAEDLSRHKTKWIIVNTQIMKIVLGEDFHYFAYFSKYPAFRRVIAEYRLVGNIDYFEIYERV